MKKLFSQILVVLFSVILISAQTEKPEAVILPEDKKPVLFDQFGSLNLEETMARLDIFLVELMNTPNANGVIRIYGGNEFCFLCRYKFGSLVNAYLKNTRKFSPERFTIEYCDETSKELRNQLYLIPWGAGLSKCVETLETPKHSALFGTVHFFYKNNKLSPFEDTSIEIGPTHGEYSVNVLKKVKDILEKSPAGKIYIIVYLGTNLDTKFEDINGKTIEKTERSLDKKSTAKRLLSNAKKELVKTGINLSQIEIIEGGYVDDRRRLEFWFVPKGGEIPKPKPDYFPKKKEKK